MRKSCLIVAGLVVFLGFVCVLVLGGWFVWSRFGKPAVELRPAQARSTMNETGKRSELPWVDVRVLAARDGGAFAGWPLMVRVSVRCPQSSDTQEPKPIVIAGPAGSWHDALKLSVEDAGGTSQQWLWHEPVAQPGPMMLDGQSGLEWVWWLTSEETQRIRPGKYTVKAVLDTSAATAAQAWKGTVSSRPSSLMLEASRRHTPQEETRKQIYTARVEALGGNNTAAIARLRMLTEREPKNVEGLALAAALLADSGRLEESLDQYNRAIEAWYENDAEGKTEPVQLLQERREVRIRLLAAEKPQGTVDPHQTP